MERQSIDNDDWLLDLDEIHLGDDGHLPPPPEPPGEGGPRRPRGPRPEPDPEPGFAVFGWAIVILLLTGLFTGLAFVVPPTNGWGVTLIIVGLVGVFMVPLWVGASWFDARQHDRSGS